MKTNLSHLPTQQAKEINIIVEALSKIKKVEKVILFGSFARGDFVLHDVSEENGTMRVYESDYDLLVIVSHYKEDQEGLIDKTINEIEQKYHIERGIDVILESITYVNKMLEENRYFYADIVKEGIVLFDTGKYTLSQAKILTGEERKEIQKRDYKKWFESGEEFIYTFKASLQNNALNNAVFQLHQALERYITAYLLVKNGYRPKTHNIETLYKLLMKCDESFNSWFDLTSIEEKKCFELLKKAYVEARYSEDYQITKDELEFLEKKVLVLKRMIEVLCEKEVGESF